MVQSVALPIHIYIRHPKTSWTFHHPEILELLVLERKCPANSRKTCKTFQKCHLDQTFRFHLKLWNQSYWVKFRKILHEQGPNGWIYIYDRSHQLLPCLITILIYGNQKTTNFRLNGKNFLKARERVSGWYNIIQYSLMVLWWFRIDFIYWFKFWLDLSLNLGGVQAQMKKLKCGSVGVLETCWSIGWHWWVGRKKVSICTHMLAYRSMLPIYRRD